VALIGASIGATLLLVAIVLSSLVGLYAAPSQME
jgi:hypothetical protein